MLLSTRRLFVGIFFVALFAMAARNVTDPDFGWHLRTGEYIVTEHSIPETDHFSFTANGQPRITHEWLVDLAIYLLYRFGGFAALIASFALVGAVTFVLLYLRCEGKPYLAAFVVLLAAAAAAPFWGVRPQTISLFFTSAFLYLLDRYRREGATRLSFLLVPLTLLWANSHGSYVLGPTLILVYLAGDLAEPILKWNGASTSRSNEGKRLFGILLLCLAVIAINPHGPSYYLFPFQTLSSSVIQTYIQEWQPPDFHSLAVQPFAAMLAMTLGAMAFSRKRIGLVETLLLVGFAYASLRAARQISIWVLVAAPVLVTGVNEFIGSLARLSNPSLTRRPSRATQVLNWSLLILAAGAALLRVNAVIGDEARAERQQFPVNAVDYIEQENLSGPIFNLYDWGGYLIWHLYPRERVFIDGRSDLYGLTGDLVVQEYLNALEGAPDWREPLERYQIRLVLIPPHSPLAAVLSQDSHWEQVYADSQAAVFRASGR